MRLKFEIPPSKSTPAAPKRSKHQTIAQALRKRPGEWARIDVKRTAQLASVTANQIRRAYLSAYEPTGSFEAIARTVNGEYRVYARYVGSE